MLLENAKGRFVISDSPMLKIGKVVAVRRALNQVDVAFLTGEFVAGIPVLCGMGGSNFGAVSLTAPTVDATTANASGGLNYSSANLPTYSPSSAIPANSEGADSTLVVPSTNLNYAPLQTSEQLVSGGSNRDIYAAVLPIEGDRMGLTGMVVLGFIYPSSAEMMFDAGINNQFSDLLLIRHPSDVQVTIDRNGFTSIQHPSGARLTIGDMNAITTGPAVAPYTPPATSDIDTPVSLTGLDSNGNYKLRANLGQLPGVMIEDAAQSQVRLDGRKDINIANSEGASVHLTPQGEVQITDKAGSTATLDGQGNLTLKASGAQIEIESNGEIVAADSVGNTVTLKGNGGIAISSQGTVAIQGTAIQLGEGPGVARQGDAVVCPAGTGYIASASTTVIAQD